jgi:V-type H+-transporting ATPase subunit E
MAQPLSNDQVQQELGKMTRFIHQEALEKAKEIQMKADEEFAIEKSKLVRQETSSIDSYYEKKFKQAAMSQQITRSTLANKTRLKVLSARQELLDELFENTAGQLKRYTTDNVKYQNICKNLILEGLYALSEDKAHIRARKADYTVVKKAMNDAQKEYKDVTGRDVVVDLDEQHPQPGGLCVSIYHYYSDFS